MRTTQKTLLARLSDVVMVTCAVGVAPGSVAWAQGGDPTMVMQPQQGTVQPQVYQAPQPAPQPVQTARQGRGLEYGGHLVIPFFVTNPVAVVVDGTGTPIAEANAGIGVGIQGRVGWEFGQGFTVELNAGGTFNTMDGELLGTGESIDVDTSLVSFWLGAGARYSFLGASALVPFVGGGAGFYFWDFCPNDAIACDRELTFGVNALGGIIYEINPFVGLEAGLQATLIFANDAVFVDPELFLSPFLGATLYY